MALSQPSHTGDAISKVYNALDILIKEIAVLKAENKSVKSEVDYLRNELNNFKQWKEV